MELQTAARVFQALGSEPRLAIYLQVASSPQGISIDDLNRRSALASEALLLGLSGLVGAGLIARTGTGSSTRYTACSHRLRKALDYAFHPDALA